MKNRMVFRMITMIRLTVRMTWNTNKNKQKILTTSWRLYIEARIDEIINVVRPIRYTSP